VSAALAMVFFTVFLQVGSFFYENHENRVISFLIHIYGSLHLLVNQQSGVPGRDSNPIPTLPHANNL
jgi:hypothetical protein